jgi:hypothetical protein
MRVANMSCVKSTPLCVAIAMQLTRLLWLHQHAVGSLSDLSSAFQTHCKMLQKDSVGRWKALGLLRDDDGACKTGAA